MYQTVKVWQKKNRANTVDKCCKERQGCCEKLTDTHTQTYIHLFHNEPQIPLSTTQKKIPKANHLPAIHRNRTFISYQFTYITNNPTKVPYFPRTYHERHISTGREMGGIKARVSIRIIYRFLLCFSSLGFKDFSIEITCLVKSDIKISCSHLFQPLI